MTTVQFPREPDDALYEYLAEKARVCGGGADEIWEGLCTRFGLQPAAQKYDDTLLPFLALMRKELADNCHKGDRVGWLRMSLEGALDEIRHHADKLIVPVMNHDREAIREHAADVANCAMMLADIAGVLSRE